MSDYKKEILSRLKGLVMVVALYYIVAWFIGCPVRFFLGISCPGCGITRAWLAALTLDFHQAFSLHPLFWMVPFLILAVLFEDKLASSRWRYVVVLICLIFIAVFFVRLIGYPDEVVYFRPKEGFIYRVVTWGFFALQEIYYRITALF